MLNFVLYSFFNVFNYCLLIIGFLSIVVKDSLCNVQEIGEFVWNFVMCDFVEWMNQICVVVLYDVNEFEFGGLIVVLLCFVDVLCVVESGVNFECKVIDVIWLCDYCGVEMLVMLVLGEVVVVYICYDLLKDGVFDMFGVGIIFCVGGLLVYVYVMFDSCFDIFWFDV